MKKQCCNLPTCERKIIATKEGKLTKENMFTCGKVHKQIDELKKIKTI
jgi:hypothetical protein